MPNRSKSAYVGLHKTFCKIATLSPDTLCALLLTSLQFHRVSLFFSPSQFLPFISDFLRKHGFIVAQRVPLPQPDPIEVADRNANFRRRFEEPKGLSFPLITLFPANWKASPLPRLVARAV